MNYPPAPSAPPAAQGQPATAPAPAGPSAPAPAGDTSAYSVHSCAMKAQTQLEKLATELAHAGAPRNVTTTVTKMADAIRQIVDFSGGKAAAQQQSAPPQAAPQQHTMSSAANSLVADVAAKKAQGGQ